MIYDDSTCYRCGANAWTSCQHRKATRERPVFVDALDKGEIHRRATGGGRFSIKPSILQGFNFKTRKRK